MACTSGCTRRRTSTPISSIRLGSSPNERHHDGPNEDQVLGFTGAADLADGCRRLLDAGAGLLGVTCGADGALIVGREGSQQVPAFAIDVVDTTGCGDAFSAGFVYATWIGRAPRDAAVLGNAVAAPVAQGLGSDHGDFDLATADALAKTSALLG